MAQKFFVYEGLEFETIEAAQRNFTGLPVNNDPVDSVTLDSVLTALGTEVVADMPALRAWWDVGESGIDEIQVLARQFISTKAPLITGTVDDVETQSITGKNLHNLSYQSILPVDLSLCITDLPGAAGDVADARDRISVKALEVRHDNIKKHAVTATVTIAQAKVAAWAAWRQYALSKEIAEETSSADNYLINPSQTT